jgi:hypothetical protein
MVGAGHQPGGAGNADRRALGGGSAAGGGGFHPGGGVDGARAGGKATGAAAVADAVLANVLLVGLAATVMGAVSLKRWGLVGAFGVALFTLGLAAACPLTGHHTFGLWFAGQSACVLGAMGVATMGLLRTRG